MALIKVYASNLAGNQAKFSDQIRAQLNSTYYYLRANFEANMRNMWRDDSSSGGLTIQQKFDALGTDAAQLFSLSSASATMLAAIDSTYTPLTPASLGHTYTLNEDGTVTVTS